MKSAMETSILLTAPSLRTSWWRKVWQFISYDWPRPSVLPLFTPLPLPFESRVERETAKEFTGENMQCYLSGGGTVAVVPLLWLHCYSNPLLMTWMLSDWFQTSQAFTLPCNLLGEQFLVTPEVDGGNLGSHGLMCCLLWTCKRWRRALVAMKPFGLQLLQCKQNQVGSPVIL